MDKEFNNDNNSAGKPKRQRKKRQIARPERNKNLNFKMRMKDGVLVDRYHITRNQLANQLPNSLPEISEGNTNMAISQNHGNVEVNTKQFLYQQ